MENTLTLLLMMFSVATVLLKLLADWGLVGVVDVVRIQDIAPLNQIKVLSYKDKGDWILETKYNIGAKKKKEEGEG